MIMNRTGLHPTKKTDRIWEYVPKKKTYGSEVSILKHGGLKKTAIGKTKNLQENLDYSNRSRC